MLSTSNKSLKYTSIAVVLVSVGILVFKLFFGGVLPFPEIERPIAKINIDWDVLRKPLEVKSPDFSVTLEANSSTTVASTSVDLIAVVEGIVNGPFSYNFDCDGDGVFELETGELQRKDYTAEGLCLYEKGKYTASVLVTGRFVYYKTPATTTEEIKEARASIDILVKTANKAPVITFCDVSPTEGTTQSTFLFTFLVEASDPDGDELFYHWEFGDEASSTQSAPSHVYKETGVHMPKVTVSDGETETSCVVRSLMILSDLIPFQTIDFPEEVGRENPFAVVASTTIEVSSTTTEVVSTTTISE